MGGGWGVWGVWGSGIGDRGIGDGGWGWLWCRTHHRRSTVFFFFLCVDVGATIADFVIGVLHVLM